MAECSVQQLLDEAKCFGCGLSTRTLEVLQLQLLCEISTTGPSGLFLAQAANLSDVDSVPTARTNLGLGTGDSPIFTGATLSGKTAGSVLFVGPGGVIDEDNPNFFYNNTNDTLILGPRSGTAVPLTNYQHLRTAAVNLLDTGGVVSFGAQATTNFTYTEIKSGGAVGADSVFSGFNAVLHTGGQALGVFGFSGLYVQSGGTSVNAYGAQFSLNQSAGTTGSARGIYSSNEIGGTASTAFYGADISASLLTGGSCPLVRGSRIRAILNTGVTNTTIYGLEVSVSGAGNATTARGLYVTNTASGTITNRSVIFAESGFASCAGLIVKGFTAQTGDLIRMTDVSDVVLAKFDSAGVLFLGTPTLRSGAGTPESAVTAPIGSLFFRTDGAAGTTLYVKESGAGNTGWSAFAGAVAGANTQVLFNDSGVYAGDAGMTYNKTTDNLTLLGGLTVTTGAVVTSLPVFSATQTWNAAGVLFTGLKFNVTNTASAASSLIVDFQLGGVTQLNLDKSGFLGVGIAAPLQHVHIQGSGTERLLLKSTAGNCSFRVDAGAGLNAGFDFFENGASMWEITHQGSSNNLLVASTSTGILMTFRQTGSIVEVMSGVHLQLGNTAAAGVVVPTHTCTMKDTAGTTYRFPCLV